MSDANNLTDQEKFWKGDFGNEYTQRNVGRKHIAANCALFAKVFALTQGVESIIEFGANQGLNLIACQKLLPDAKLTGVEINTIAIEQLKSLDGIEVIDQSILNLDLEHSHDLAFTKGVLIHIHPDHLNKVYDNLYRTSKRYIFLSEYYNPTPLELNYRGHQEKMFKRDFAGELLDRFSDLELVDYGFAYHRDPTFPQDDNNWFLLEKKA